MPRLRIAAPHGPRALRLSGGRSRRLLTHDKGAVPTDDEYAAWVALLKNRSKLQLQQLVSHQRTLLTKKAEELKLPFADAAEHIAAAFELAKQESAAKAEERERFAAGWPQREREREREKELRVLRVFRVSDRDRALPLGSAKPRQAIEETCRLCRSWQGRRSLRSRSTAGQPLKPTETA
jgi:hypothetical protein